MAVTPDSQLSLAYGAPLSAESGIGTLTLGAYLREITNQFGPREAAVVDLAGGTERWSYDDLWQRSMSVARALITCGVGKGTRVGLLMTNRLEFLSCLFGTALCGGVATPISTFFTASELEAVLQTSGCSVLLLERHVLKKDFAAMLCELEPQLRNATAEQLASTRFPFLHHLACVDDDTDTGLIEGWPQFLARANKISPDLVDATAAAVMPSDPGTLFFSSGSTGKAKGILSSHRAVCLQLWRWRQWYDIQQPPRTWSSNGFFFSGNFSMSLGSTLSSGGTLVLQRYFEPEAALALMEKEHVSMLLAWPHQWAQLEAASNYSSVNLAALHYIDAQSPIARHPTVKTEWRDPKHAYGSTETFTLISVFPSTATSTAIANSHGLPTAGSTIKIVDPETGETMPLGQRGEIAVKGPTLMLGYIGIPLDETLDAEGFFCTGDGGFIDDAGRLFWEGRLSDIIKTGGANVSPLEVDDVIRRCPGVKISQTLGLHDELLGELVVTCVVAHEGQALSEDDVRNFSRQQLASYKVPRRVFFLAEDELPTTGSAKIRTAELKQRIQVKISI